MTKLLRVHLGWLRSEESDVILAGKTAVSGCKEFPR